MMLDRKHRYEVWVLSAYRVLIGLFLTELWPFENVEEHSLFTSLVWISTILVENDQYQV